MDANELALAPRKRIALVAHDNEKDNLLAWCAANRETLSHHELFATGNTGLRIARDLHLDVHVLRSGPLGGDQQIGSRITEGGIDVLLFFWDPLQPQPHEPDVRALLRIAVLWNVPVACNRSTADFLITSRLFGEQYARRLAPALAT